MNSSRRGFIKGLSALGAAAGGGFAPFGGFAQNNVSGGKPLLKFGVVSDVHVRLEKNGMSFATGYDTTAFERTLSYFRDSGVDAVMIAGDIADSGLLGELKAVADTWYRVFPDDKAPDGRKVERLFVFGNHDSFGLKNGKRVFQDDNVLKREAIEADPRRAWDVCFHEEWKPYFTKNVNGFDFFCSHWQPGIWCNGVAETGSNGCADAFRSLMEKSDPSRPFFYVQHPHPRDTVYGRDAWGMDDGTATRLLSAFPQAVAFSGHSHEPLTNERAIWRGAFTSVATGSLRYLSGSSVWCRSHTPGYENGACNVYMPGVKREDRQAFVNRYDAGKVMESKLKVAEIRVGQIVNVYEDRIVFEKREFMSGLQLCEDWVVERPARPLSFSVRAKAAKPAQFPAGATLAVSRTEAKTRGAKGFVDPKTVPAVKFDFPAAIAGGRVAEYEIAAENAGGTLYTTRICAKGGLYPEKHRKFAAPVTAMVPASVLPEGAVLFRVTPLDSFGNRGVPLEAQAT